MSSASGCTITRQKLNGPNSVSAVQQLSPWHVVTEGVKRRESERIERKTVMTTEL